MVLFKVVWRTGLFVVLTVLTQIGGIAYLLSLMARRLLKPLGLAGRGLLFVLFLSFYAALSYHAS